MNKFQQLLKGDDLRSIGRANEVVAMVKTQQDFDELFSGFHHGDRTIVMRTADAIEKISLKNADFLQKHKSELLRLCETAKGIEVKWHLALLVSRLNLTKRETGKIWNLLAKWATDKGESKIVRVNSIQGLFHLLQQNSELAGDFNLMLSEIRGEKIPSLNARINKLQNNIS